MLCHETLINVYKTNFVLLHHYKYSLTELDEMIPWEREVYIALIIDHLEKEKERQEAEKSKYS